MLPDGYATAEYTYNDEGRLTMTQYRNVNGEKVTCSGGYSAVRQTWDGDRLAGKVFLDENGNSTDSSSGICEERYLYDTDGLLRVIQQYKTDGTQIK